MTMGRAAAPAALRIAHGDTTDLDAELSRHLPCRGAELIPRTPLQPVAQTSRQMLGLPADMDFLALDPDTAARIRAMTNDMRRTIQRQNRPVMPELDLRPFILPRKNPLGLFGDESLP